MAVVVAVAVAVAVAGVATNGSPRDYALVPLPELGLGTGGWSGKATSKAATGRSRVDTALAQARVRIPLGK